MQKMVLVVWPVLRLRAAARCRILLLLCRVQPRRAVDIVNGKGQLGV